MGDCAVLYLSTMAVRGGDLAAAVCALGWTVVLLLTVTRGAV